MHSHIGLPGCSHGWRELYRCHDLLEARAVATSIGSMEFEVRLIAADTVDGLDDASQSMQEFVGPFVVEVPEIHWVELREVLGEIIAEQREFDEWIELRTSRKHARLFIVLGATGIVHGMVIWHFLDK